MARKFNKTVLSFHAHPDDTEAWCAGTLKLLKDKGYKIVIATMTAGGMGGINSTEEATIAMRKEEARKAAAILDAEYYCFEGRDGFLFDTVELRLEAISLMRKVNAGIVITHLPMDYHSDHRTTCNIVESAAIISSLPNVPVKEKPLEVTPLLYHSAPLTLSDPIGADIVPPHFYVDVTSVMETKMNMIAYHHSQIELMKVMHKMDDFFGVLKQANAGYGKMVEVDYAEVFWQHLGGGFQREAQIQDDLKDFILTK
ncbi:MAG: PIG-L family deacetylase [Bacteroidales bacterium]|nr:PIG-L family deacetylase [Bacteroidales bacterium]